MGTSEKHLKSNIHMLRILRACICFKPDLYRYAEAKSFHPVKPFNEIQKNSQLARHPWNASLKNRRNIQPSSDITNFDSWKRFEIDFFFVSESKNAKLKTKPCSINHSKCPDKRRHTHFVHSRNPRAWQQFEASGKRLGDGEIN